MANQLAIQRRVALPKKPKAPKVKVAKAPKIPAIRKYLGMDTDYQRTLNNLNTNLGAYRTQNLNNRRALTADYNTTKNRLTDQQKLDTATQNNDFAARGMFGSGGQAKAANDLTKSYNQQFGDADVSFTRNKTSLLSDLADARRLKTQNAADARAEAIRRRAAQYGITGNPVAKPKATKKASGKKAPVKKGKK